MAARHVHDPCFVLLLVLLLGLLRTTSAFSFSSSSTSSCPSSSSSSTPSSRRGRQHGALHMRTKPSGEERERGVAEKELREKQSQVLLSQRIQHIRRLRTSRREDIMESEWYNPKKPNPDWRNAAGGSEGGREGGEAAAMEELSAMLEFKAERGSGGSVVNVYAKEDEAAQARARRMGGANTPAAVAAAAAAGVVVPLIPPPPSSSSSSSFPSSSSVLGGQQEEQQQQQQVVIGKALKRHDYAPLAAWRCLKRSGEAGGGGVQVMYNSVRGTSNYVIVLVDPSQSPVTLVEGLKRMRIIPPSLAAVVGVTTLPPQDAQRLAKKSGLLPVPAPSSSPSSSSPSLLSDPSHQWMDAHGIPRLSLRPLLFVLDGKKGTVLSVVRDPVPGAINDLVMEVVGDWRGRG